MFQRIETYLNHHVIIEADGATTQIIFVPQPPASDYFHVNDPPFTLEKVRALLASPALASLQYGKVYAEAGGRSFITGNLGERPASRKTLFCQSWRTWPGPTLRLSEPWAARR